MHLDLCNDDLFIHIGSPESFSLFDEMAKKGLLRF
jgi:hypothetical protein